MLILNYYDYILIKLIYCIFVKKIIVSYLNIYAMNKKNLEINRLRIIKNNI